MGARKDGVKIDGKQYLRKTESVDIDLDCDTVDQAIAYLEELREQYGGDAYLSLEPEIAYEYGSEYARLDQTLSYERLETDEEREKRLEQNKRAREKAKEKRRKDKELQEQRELDTLRELAEKHGRKVV